MCGCEFPLCYLGAAGEVEFYRGAGEAPQPTLGQGCLVMMLLG